MSNGFLVLFIPVVVFGFAGGILGAILFALAYKFRWLGISKISQKVKDGS